jgi:hypothetical protein
LKNIKIQAPNLKVSGFGCQVSGKKNKKLKPEHWNLKPLLPAELRKADLARRTRFPMLKKKAPTRGKVGARALGRVKAE